MTHASLGMGWQAVGGAAAVAITAYTMFPVVLPKYTRRYFERLSTSDLVPEKPDEHTLSLVDDVSQQLIQCSQQLIQCSQ